MNGEDVMKKAPLFHYVKEVRGGSLGRSDDIQPDWLVEIAIDAILGHEKEMNLHTTTRKLALPLSFSQRMINHLQYD
jgi:hypothetical protein